MIVGVLLYSDRPVDSLLMSLSSAVGFSFFSLGFQEEENEKIQNERTHP